MRLKWDEKAKRLAEEHAMVEEIETYLSCNCAAVGKETGSELIRWFLSEDTICVQET